MDNVWTWKGKYFGYLRDDRLFTHNGRSAGILSNGNIFDRNGRYIGELRGSNRLITHKQKKNLRGPKASLSVGTSRARCVNYVGNVMLVGYEDFPLPENFG